MLRAVNLFCVEVWVNLVLFSSKRERFAAWLFLGWLNGLFTAKHTGEQCSFMPQGRSSLLLAVSVS